MFAAPIPALCSDLQEVLHKVRCVTSQCHEDALCTVVTQNSPRAHRALDHKPQFDVTNAQREECAERVVDVSSVCAVELGEQRDGERKRNVLGEVELRPRCDVERVLCTA